MRISFITDEATQSFREAVELAGTLGLEGLELRSVEDLPIDRVPADRLRAWKRELDAAGLGVPCVAGSFYKCEPGDPAVIRGELLKLERLCDAADILDCGYIRGFTFFSSPLRKLTLDELLRFFAPASDILRKRGKVLLLEADPSVNTTNHASLAGVLDRLDPELYGAVYDAGNDLYDPLRETPYPAGYEVIKPYLRHVHVKDAVYGPDGEAVCLAPGRGLVDWPAILRRLMADGYRGWLSLEPHYRTDTVLTEEQMRLPQGSSFSKGGKGAVAQSAAALRTLIAEAEKAGEQL